MKKIIFILAITLGFFSCQKDKVEPLQTATFSVVFELDKEIDTIFVFETNSVNSTTPNDVEGNLSHSVQLGCSMGFNAEQGTEYVFRYKDSSGIFVNLWDAYFKFNSNDSNEPLGDRYYQKGVKPMIVTEDCQSKDFTIKTKL